MFNIDNRFTPLQNLLKMHNLHTEDNSCTTSQHELLHEKQTVHIPLFLRKTDEIEDFAWTAAILDECQIYLY